MLLSTNNKRLYVCYSLTKACLNLKTLIETNQMKLCSKTSISELKTFVRRGGTYQAQLGSTDDCITATLIIVRLIEEIAMHDTNAYNALYSVDESQYIDDNNSDENDDPLPVVF